MNLLKPARRISTTPTDVPPPLNTSNSLLLYDATSQKLSYTTENDLAELKKRKLVWKIEVPLLAKHVDIHIGFSREQDLGTVKLPTKVFLGRLLGWWECLYVIQGVEDV